MHLLYHFGHEIVSRIWHQSRHFICVGSDVSYNRYIDVTADPFHVSLLPLSLLAPSIRFTGRGTTPFTQEMADQLSKLEGLSGNQPH